MLPFGPVVSFKPALSFNEIEESVYCNPDNEFHNNERSTIEYFVPVLFSASFHKYGELLQNSNTADISLDRPSERTRRRATEHACTGQQYCTRVPTAADTSRGGRGVNRGVKSLPVAYFLFPDILSSS